MSADAREHTLGWCCVDCLMLLANGDDPPEWTEEQCEEWHAEIDRRTEGCELTLGAMLGEVDGCECTEATSEEHGDECERLTFSWSPCDVCGSRLGGERHAATFWTEEPSDADVRCPECGESYRAADGTYSPELSENVCLRCARLAHLLDGYG